MGLFLVIFLLLFFGDVGWVVEEGLFAVGVDFEAGWDLQVRSYSDVHRGREGEADEVYVREPVPVLGEDQEASHCLELREA